MNLVLAATWHPRGEFNRLYRLMQRFKSVYSELVIVVPPAQSIDELGLAEVSLLKNLGEIIVYQAEQWSVGRYLALQTALKTNGTYFHYADLDRLLRWVETHPKEWQHTCQAITRADCLIIGRSPKAYQTHPEALINTEAISNMVVAFFLGGKMDVSAGSKGFSRSAVEYLMEKTSPSGAMGADAEWAITLFNAGFKVDYIEVDGLGWESADHYQDKAANTRSRKRAAKLYDKNPVNWARRVEVAYEIVETALRTAGSDYARREKV